MNVKARDEIIAQIIEHEGSVADVKDGKGVTRWGQTPGWLSQFNLPIPTNATEAAENYAEWMRITRLDQIIGQTPDALAHLVIDLSVHSGHVVGITALQRAVKVTEDGVIGPQTLEAIRIESDRINAFIHILAFRIVQQGSLIARDWREAKAGRLPKGQDERAKFAHGWMIRNATHLRRLIR